MKFSWICFAGAARLVVVASGDAKASTCAGNSGIYASSLVSWDELSAPQQAALKLCGYKKTAWDGPTKCQACFYDLSDALQKAVVTIGTDCHCWNEYVAQTKNCPPCPPASRPNKLSCEKDSGIYNTSYISWRNLSPRQQEAARKCDYDKVSWDYTGYCTACFEDLSQEKQQAVMNIGSDASCWNKMLSGSYGLDCKKLLTNTPDATDRNAIYAGLSLKFQLQRTQLQAALTSPVQPSMATFSTTVLFLLSLSFALVALSRLWQRGQYMNVESLPVGLEDDTCPAE